MEDSNDLVGIIEEWFTIHGLDQRFSGPMIVETSSQAKAVMTKEYLEKNPHPTVGSRYKYEVEISPRLKKGEVELTYELKVCLDAAY